MPSSPVLFSGWVSIRYLILGRATTTTHLRPLAKVKEMGELRLLVYVLLAIQSSEYPPIETNSKIHVLRGNCRLSLRSEGVSHIPTEQQCCGWGGGGEQSRSYIRGKHQSHLCQFCMGGRQLHIETFGLIYLHQQIIKRGSIVKVFCLALKIKPWGQSAQTILTQYPLQEIHRCLYLRYETRFCKTMRLHSTFFVFVLLHMLAKRPGI